MSTEVRYGVIGTGMMGIEHILNIEAIDDARVTAIADPVESSRQAAVNASASADLAVFDDHRALLSSSDVDAVVIASPNMTHAEILGDVFETRGDLHVLTEKPLCTTVADCRRVVEQARGREGIVWMGLEYRYKPSIARLVAEVVGGVAGQVRMVAIREHRFPFLPKVGDWNRFNRNTGGTLVEKCCHFFDLMNLIIGARPTSVMASGAQDVNHLDEEYHGEVPDIMDNAFVLVDFENGARAMLDLCMFAEGSLNEQEISVTGDVGKVEAFVPQNLVRVGRRVDGRNVGELIVEDDRVAYEGLHEGSSYLEHLDFVEAIRSGSPPKVTLEDGLWAVAVGEAGHRSIAEGRPILISEVMPSLDS